MIRKSTKVGVAGTLALLLVGSTVNAKTNSNFGPPNKDESPATSGGYRLSITHENPFGVSYAEGSKFKSVKFQSSIKLCATIGTGRI